MKKERKYLRANSKANIEDAIKLYRVRYSKYHDIKITYIYLVKD